MIIDLMLIKSSIQESYIFCVIVTCFFISSPTFQLIHLCAYPACMLWGTLDPALLKRAFVNFILNCGSIYKLDGIEIDVSHYLPCWQMDKHASLSILDQDIWIWRVMEQVDLHQLCYI